MPTSLFIVRAVVEPHLRETFDHWYETDHLPRATIDQAGCSLRPMTTLHRLWHGEVPLPQVFWNWAVFGGIAVNGLTSILFLTLLLNGQTVAAFVVGYALSVPYNTFVTVAVWRSAGRYEGERRWADLARFVTVIGMTLLSLT